jgi:Acyltransferase family
MNDMAQKSTIAHDTHQPGARKSVSFRPDIEGLRGIAVLLVVAFHSHILLFRGGFLGVDIFFVLSGYLITALLLQELESTGTLSLVGFYARRARRLLPAAAVVVAFIVVVGIFLLSPIEQLLYSKTALATTLYTSNLWFIHQSSDYFAADTANNPLLHTWSLAVEEQFYFVWPILVWVGFRLTRPVQDPGSSFSSFTRSLHLADPNQPAMGIFRLAGASLGVWRGWHRVHDSGRDVYQPELENDRQLDQPRGGVRRRHAVPLWAGISRIARGDSSAGDGDVADRGRGRGYCRRREDAGSSHPAMVRTPLLLLVSVALATADFRGRAFSKYFDVWAFGGSDRRAAGGVCHSACH